MNGIFYFLEGFRLISQRGMKRFVILPLVINIILFAGLFIVSRHYFAEFNHWLQHLLPHWLHWLGSILWLLFIGIFFLVVIYTFVTLANLAGAPFNCFLSEKVELALTGKTARPQSFVDAIKDTPRSFARQFSILGYYLPRAALIFVLLFFPVIQLAVAPLWLLFNAWFMALQSLDYPADIHRVSVAELREKMREKPLLALMFGSSVLVFSMVPVVNFFVVPAAVAGATKLWIEEF